MRSLQIRLQTNRPRQRQRAFTLPEVFVSMAILMMILAAVISSHLFGVRLYTITKVKLGALQEARQSLSEVILDVRSAWRIEIGNLNQGAFVECLDGLPQQGAAIRIFPSSNETYFVTYYRDADKKLKRQTSRESTPRTLAQFITNNLVFAAQTCSNTVCTNTQVNRVISLDMQFYQVQYPIVVMGSNSFFDRYQLRTKITPRTFP